MKVHDVIEVGAFIRDARTRRGLTQSALAESAGISEKWVSRVERGDAPNVSLVVVLSLCAVLELTLNLSEPSTIVPTRHRIAGAELVDPVEVLPPIESTEVTIEALDRLREQIDALEIADPRGPAGDG
jgi:transcriptional regulator with XRE-family HTH domain